VILGRCLRRLRRRDGYTLIELVVVLAIFLVVVTALTQLFTSGAKAELDLNRRFQAQQEARLALDRMRRELHCADSIVPGADGDADGNVASITVTLPSQCPSAKGQNISVVYDTSSAGTNRWKVRRTQNSVTIPIADYITHDDPFRYTAPSSTSRGLLHVDFPVNVYPNEGWKQWRLVDDIVLRNTLRE
jgi:prepilin-type N-terminal cleavage/methylation domain-containing protein